LFYALAGDLPATWANDRLILSQGIGIAIDVAFAETKAEASRKVGVVLDEAFPGFQAFQAKTRNGRS